MGGSLHWTSSDEQSANHITSRWPSMVRHTIYGEFPYTATPRRADSEGPSVPHIQYSNLQDAVTLVYGNAKPCVVLTRERLIGLSSPNNCLLSCCLRRSWLDSCCLGRRSVSTVTSLVNSLVVYTNLFIVPVPCHVDWALAKPPNPAAFSLVPMAVTPAG